MKISKTAVISKNKLKRRVFFIIGTLFFSIGITGLLIPGLPTTIFVNKNGEEFARIIGFVNFDDKKIIQWLKKYE